MKKNDAAGRTAQPHSFLDHIIFNRKEYYSFLEAGDL